jgi:PAS domain S-box-containing protein
VLPLALAVLSLVSLVLVLVGVEHQTRSALDEFTAIVDPARAAVTTIELTLALERSDVAGFLLTGDPRFATSHAYERTTRLRAQGRLLPLARQLGPDISNAATALVDHLQTADATLDSLYDGRLPRSTYTQRFDQERIRFASIIQEAGRVEAAILATATQRQRAFASAQRLAAWLSTGLAFAAFIALVLLARLSVGFRSRAIRLDEREQQQTALRETARSLNAAVSINDAARILADGALAGTTAVGAIAELARMDGTDRTIVAGSTLRGAAAKSSEIPYDQSLTKQLAESEEGRVDAGVELLLDRMAAPAQIRREDLRCTITPVLFDQRPRGALGVARPTASARTTSTEDSYLGALTELATLVLRRVDLVSQLRESEERFRQVADNIRGFVWLREPASLQFLYANPGYEEIFGRSREDIYRDGTTFFEGVHPDDRERVAAAIPQQEPYEVQYRVIRPDGELRWVWSRAFPVRDENGVIRRMAGVTEDITEWKRSELAQQQLVEGERAARESAEAAHAAAERRREELERVTESRTRLVRGFTHDVKNPLGAADGFLALLEEGVFGKLTDEQHDAVMRARGSIHRALELINGALELARADAAQLELHHETVDMRATVDEVANEYAAQAEAKGQDVKTDVASDVPAINSDPSRIRQVVGNLLSNAIKYTPEHGRIGIHVAAANGRGPAGGDWIVIDVSDTGPGIPADQIQNIFKEFTRLHPEAAGGAGVGLAISQRLARALGGRITVESQEGEGSTFSLWLPRNGTTNGDR